MERRTDSAELTQADGYVSWYGIYGYSDVKAGNISIADFRIPGHVQLDECANDQFPRYIKFRRVAILWFSMEFAEQIKMRRFLFPTNG